MTDDKLVAAEVARNKLIGTLITAIQALTTATTSLPGAYQSGTWTPTLLGDGTAGTPTYTLQVGSYEKIGRLVVARFSVAISAVGGMTGNLRIGGLPFQSVNTANDLGALTVANYTGLTLSAGYTQVSATVVQNAQVGAVYESGSASTATLLPITGVAATTSVVGTFVYRTAGN